MPLDIPQLEAAFRQNFAEGKEVGASVSVWRQGQEIVTFTGGATSRHGARPWQDDTLVPIYSATKGPAVTAVLVLLDRAGMDLSTPVTEVWPEFGQNGKSGLAVGDLLSHQGGVAALERTVDVRDYPAVIAALEDQVPNWQPGFGHGYHPRTFGFLLDELARRLDPHRRPLGQAWRTLLADPLGLDIWIGLPATEHQRVATLYPGRLPKGGTPSAFAMAFSKAGTLTRRAFDSPRGLHAVADMNQAAAWEIGLPAFGGLASARGLAKFYSLLASGAGNTFSKNVLHWLESPLSEGTDRVLLEETVFTAGMQKDPTDGSGRKSRQQFGISPRAFGHPGAGGSHAFADPESGLGFAYVMNQMEVAVLPGERVLRMVRTLA